MVLFKFKAQFSSSVKIYSETLKGTTLDMWITLDDTFVSTMLTLSKHENLLVTVYGIYCSEETP